MIRAWINLLVVMNYGKMLIMSVKTVLQDVCLVGMELIVILV